MKLFTKFFALLLIAVCAFTVIACKDADEGDKKEYTDWCYEFEVDTDDDAKVYATITGLFVPDTMLKDYANGLIAPIDLVVGSEQDGKIGLKAQKNDKAIDTEKYKLTYADGYYYGFDYLTIGDDAFANQTIIGSVKVAASVEEIGSACFAGCSNITKMELPFVGSKAQDALNEKKVFANLFGTSEVTGCSSTTVYYNSSSSKAFFIPDGLKEIVINYADEVQALPVCAFNSLSKVSKITINGKIKTIGQSAFASCSALVEANLPATVEYVGAKAFENCSALVRMDITAMTALKAIYQEAFSGCSSLGLGYQSITVSAADIYEKAFANCTAVKAVDLSATDTVRECAFYGCTALETVALKEGAVVASDAFEKTAYAENN